MTVGAVNAVSGHMRYFDTRKEKLGADHVMASGALPPAFGAIRIDGEPYWDGGIYSNTPIEAVLDDKPRRDSVIFAVNVWHQTGPEPASIREVMGRQKDIQFASRADSHIARQKQIHQLRHVIRELHGQIAAGKRDDAEGQGARVVGLRHDHARGAPGRAARGGRGPHQGHRLHARRRARAPPGRLRRHAAHDRARRRGRRRPPTRSRA